MQKRHWWGEVSDQINGRFSLGDKSRCRYLIQGGIVVLPTKEPIIILGKLGLFGANITEVGFIRLDEVEFECGSTRSLRSKNGLSWKHKSRVRLKVKRESQGFRSIPIDHMDMRASIEAQIEGVLQKAFQKLEYQEIINLNPDQLSSSIVASANSALGVNFPYYVLGVLLFDIEPADAAAAAALAEEAKVPISKRKHELEVEIRKEKRKKEREEEIDENEYKRNLEKLQQEHDAELAEREEIFRKEREKRDLEHTNSLRARELEFSAKLDQFELENALKLANFKAIKQLEIYKIEAASRREIAGLDADEHLRIESERLVYEISRLQQISALPDEPSRVIALLGTDNYIKLEEMAKEVQIAQASGNHNRYAKVLGFALSAAQAQGKGQAFLEILDKNGILDRSKIEVDMNFNDLGDDDLKADP